MTSPNCPRCGEPTSDLDRYGPIADGTVWHVLCYQSAWTSVGANDPFPECYDCGMLIWESSATVAPVGGGGTERLWHPECAPGAPTRGRVENDPVPSVMAREVEAKRAKARHAQQTAAIANVGEAPTSTNGVKAPRAKRTTKVVKQCSICSKRIVGNVQALDDGRDAHVRCAKRVEREASGQAPRASKEPRAARAARAPRVKKLKPTPTLCPSCEKKVNLSEANAEKVVVFSEEKLAYHKRCYRKAIMATGAEDPFPRAARPKRVKVILLKCPLCKQKVPRDSLPDGTLGFREHFAVHDEERAVGKPVAGFSGD